MTWCAQWQRTEGDFVQGELTYPFDKAAEKLCQKMGWTGTLVRGSLGPDTEVYVWVEGPKVEV